MHADGKPGVKLCSRYSRVPNSLGFCGPGKIQAEFSNCIVRSDCDSAERSLMRFEGLFPYLELIANKHGRSPFDYDVVEAYWLGNRLLEGFSRNEFAAHLDALVRHGLPKSLAEALKLKLPENPLPMHLFNVIFVGVGNISGSVKPILRNMDKCRVSWGEVISIYDIKKGALKVKYQPLTYKKGIYSLGKPVEKNVSYSKELLPGISEGDTVSMHWDEACEKLTAKRTENLNAFTQKVLNLVSTVG